MNFIIILTAISLIVAVNCGRSKKRNHNDVGFYWDDYALNKIIKAVKGGKDHRNHNTYIGLAKHVEGNKELLIPGVIYRQGNMIYEWDKNPQAVTSSFKILCTEYPDHMKWIPTNTNDIKQLLNEKELIPAGFNEEHRKYYIGRIRNDDGLILGKVIISNNDQAGFHALVKSKYIHKTDFEVLVDQMM